MATMSSIQIESLINKTLNRKFLNENIFEKISKSNLPFISITCKKLISDFLTNDSLENSTELWKNLLIDSICILKINDSREKIYNDAKNDITNFIENFDSIRKMNTYGIDEIDKYFEDFVEFESVLYGTDNHYRDHVMHVLQVWAIGYLFRTKSPSHFG